MHEVRTERDRGVSVIRGSGELDAYAAPELESAFARLRDEHVLLADLGSVSFMDSTALGVVVRCVRELDENDVVVRVVLPRGTARRIFEMTALDHVLPVAVDRVAALDDLAARRP
jgi:anti-sigma B factor antagonist